jgi:Tfp pilus assembly protein PilO
MKLFSDSSLPRRGNWLLTSALAGLTVVYFAFAYFPARKAMTAMSAELELKRQQVLSSAGLPHEILAVRERLAGAEQYLAQQRQAAAASGSAMLLGNISAIASNAGVRTTRFEPAAAVAGEQLVQFPLLIVCAGSFAQIFELVEGVERLQQPVSIEELHIETRGTAEGELNCQLKLAAFNDKSNISD